MAGILIPAISDDIWWTLGDSNSSPPECKTGALPNELRALILFDNSDNNTTISELLRKEGIIKDNL